MTGGRGGQWDSEVFRKRIKKDGGKEPFSIVVPNLCYNVFTCVDMILKF